MSQVEQGCKVNECGRKVSAREMCSTHYSRWRIHGDPTKSLYIVGDDETRFWSKVNKSADCWEWLASRNEDGYGLFRVAGKTRKAHRVAYEMTLGEIASDLDLDHRCRNRGCVNPEHLRTVTNKLNHENRGIDSNNTSGYRGVSFHRGRGKWVALVRHNGRRYCAGYFDDASEANVAVVALRNKLFTHNEMDRSTR